MGTHQDPLQRAVIGFLAMMRALLYSALNALVGMAIHFTSSFVGDVLIMTQRRQNILPILSYNN